MSSRMEKNAAKYNLRNKKYRKKVPPPDSSSSESCSENEFASECETIYSTASDQSSESTSMYNESSDTEQSSLSPKKKFDEKGFHNMLAKMFPSKYSKSKAKNTSDKAEKTDKPDRSAKSHKERSSSSSKAAAGKNRKHKKPVSDSDQSDIDIEDTENSESESDNDERDEEGSGSETESVDERERSPSSSKKRGKKINIIFTIGQKGRRGGAEEGDEDDDEDEFYSDEDSYMESGDEDQCNSEDEATFMKECYDKIDRPAEEVADVAKSAEETTTPEKEKSSKKQKGRKEREEPISRNAGKSSASAKKEPAKEKMSMSEDIESEYLELVDVKKRLTKELALRPTNKILKRSVQECTDSIRELIKKARRENTRKYRKMVYANTRPKNEMEYFKLNLSHKEQKKAMEDLQEIHTHIYTEKPYRLSLLQSKMPAKCKAIAMQKLNILRTMDPSDSEYYKIKNWVDTFMKIPFGLYKSVSVSVSDGIEKCNDFLMNAKQTLDDCTYGLNDAKMQIMQMLGQWMVNPVSVGTAIAIHGPMGTGKTTLVKDGISKILGREFTFIALGGSGDSSFLEGHSYTYEGSTWGKIVQILIDSKCMNPVIYFDELDKVSDTPRGQEIIGILTHLIDTSQNTQFHDKYFSEVDFDLSKCLFIFSYNDENLVNPILRDRMYHIRTKGYDAKDKVVIARNYLLPKIREQVCFSETDVVISDETIRYIIATFTKNESGVRNLKRCLEIIYSKLNLFRLVSAENKMFSKDMNLDVSFPITITKKEIDSFIKNDEVISQSMLAMYV